MKYEVVALPFAERHYIKSFAKKYQDAWTKTLKALTIEFTFVELLFEKTIAQIISVSSENDIKICKTEFKVLGTKISRHASGYRCIVAIHDKSKTVNVLLVYGKGNMKGKNETAWWKKLVKDTYPEYRDML